jgi:predicted esterase
VEVLTQLGGNVTVQLYPNMAHTISQAEIDFTRNMMSDVLHHA